MKKWKRVVSLALVAVLSVSLCACKGKRAENDGSGGKKGESGSTIGKECVYRMDAFDLSSFQRVGDGVNLRGVMDVGDKVYVIAQFYNSSMMGQESYKLVAMDKTGSNVESYDLTLPDLKPAAASTNTTGAEDIPQAYENTYITSIDIAGGEVLYGGMEYIYEDYSNPDQYINISKRYLCCWDLKGKLLWNKELEELSQEDKYFNLNRIMGLEDGGAVLLVNGDQNGKLTVDKEGNLSTLQSVSDELSDIFNNIGNSCKLSDGKLLISYYGSDWRSMYVVEYDVLNDTLGESTQLPTSISYNGMYGFNVDKNGDLIYGNNEGLNKYHIGDEEPTQMMNFVNSDLDLFNINNVVIIDDEKFVGFYNEYDEENGNNVIKGGLFTRVAPEDIPDKAVMVVAGNYIPDDLKKRVINYNKNSETHRIILKAYNQYATYDDYRAGYTQLNNDIITGNMPDILVVDAYGLTLENYISKGLLADVGALIAADDTLSKTEFLQNVFDACKVDGKLYEIVPTFYVRTYLGKHSLLEGRTGWNWAEAKQFMDSMPEGTTLFGSDMVRRNFLSEGMQICGRDFIDVSTGKCNFESEDFISLLEYAKNLPEQMEDSYYEGDWYAAYESQYRENRTILANCYMSGTQDLVYTINGAIGEDVDFVGFPSQDKQGSALMITNSYALAANSPNLQAAWDFMKYYLTDEYQETLQWQFPVNKACFDKVAEKGTKKPTYKDEYGQEVEEEYTYWVNDEQMTLEPLTRQQLEEIKEFVTSLKKRQYINDAVLNIVTEEADAFFHGQKSAKDVAGIIQSRAQIYVNENR